MYCANTTGNNFYGPFGQRANMEQFYNQEILTENTQTRPHLTRPHLTRRDLVIWLLATLIMVGVVWQKTRPVPVLPRPQSSEVLRYFCERP